MSTKPKEEVQLDPRETIFQINIAERYYFGLVNVSKNDYTYRQSQRYSWSNSMVSWDSSLLSTRIQTSSQTFSCALSCFSYDSFVAWLSKINNTKQLELIIKNFDELIEVVNKWVIQ